MKKRTKIGIGGAILLSGVFILSGCTASFCSKTDKAHMLYAYDYGVSNYCDSSIEGAIQVFDDNSELYYTVVSPAASGSGIGKTNATAISSNIKVPTYTYWAELDKVVLTHALAEYNSLDGVSQIDKTSMDKDDVLTVLDTCGYTKFDGEKLWDNWDSYNQEVRLLIDDASSGLTIDDVPTNDYVKLYKQTMNNLIANYRSCIAIDDGTYGYYGYVDGIKQKGEIPIESKTWGFAWSKGLFEGLLVYPIGWLTETFTKAFSGMKTAGVPQLLSILLVTVIVRSLMLIVTLKQTTSNARMQALQPEITKIQNKYPNANTNTYEKQRMAEEMSKLYKKNKINPLTTLLVMIVQFPVFICVWGALQGSASLSSDAFLGLHLSDSISSVLFDKACWSWNGGAPTALILFILMSGVQVVSMLLPQWIQKKKQKKVASLGKNPAKKEQDNKMKIFTYVMMVMIIIMGFSLASAMGVYWLVGALFSIGQTLIIEAINNRKSKKGK